jgi:hypothetical protein
MEVSGELHALAALFPVNIVVSIEMGGGMLNGSQSRSGRYVEEKNSLPISEFEPRTVRRMAVAVLNTLLRLPWVYSNICSNPSSYAWSLQTWDSSDCGGWMKGLIAAVAWWLSIDCALFMPQ